VHLRPYPVPHTHQVVFKKELDPLCEIGVLTRIGATKWAAPIFIIPKKDGQVRWVSNFQERKHKIYPLQQIQDISSSCQGYKYLTKLNILMQYYTFELTDHAKELCVIITPFGKF
jgi:hypothetical protein